MGANQVPKPKNNNFYVIRHSGFPDRSNFAIDRRYSCLQYETAWALGTCWPWENAAAFPVCSAAQGASVPTWGEGGRGHIMAATRLQLV